VRVPTVIDSFGFLHNFGPPLNEKANSVCLIERRDVVV